ncbi:hypothetical protein TWF594_009528 [Orbilia oligospora]|uniref:Cleft lip and palate transmembrane protein 1 n=1 Tax=Orbilia oligospora TaxID=2813651 RepID=A0A7C8JQ44_ORBOL|nr:hypothetical protein TWF594_009528 [Orbilia oligospora]KAF3138840.1 hypothetical protein TWF703_004381 [Orbilia oligospora]
MPPGQGQPQRRPAQNEDPPIWRTIVNSIIMVIAFQSIWKIAGTQMGWVKPGPGAANKAAPVYPAPPLDPSEADQYEYKGVPDMIYPLWEFSQPVDISVYITEHPGGLNLADPAVIQQNRVFHTENYKMDDTSEDRGVSTTVKFSDQVQHNGTLWAVIYVHKHGITDHDASNSFAQYKLLTRFMPKKKIAKVKKLLGGNKEEEVEEEVEPESHTEGPTVATYWHPNVTINIVGNTGPQQYPSMHPAMRQHYSLERNGARDQYGKNSWFYPVVFVNDFWLLKEHMMPINETVKTQDLHINVYNIPNWKYNIYASMDQAFKIQAQQNNAQGAELEEVKRILIDTNIYLLSTTVIVSLLHTVFEMLAFKSDISHFRNKKDNVGVSFRTILGNVIMQLIIFLYLIDNSDGTSWMILFGQGTGILIEAWKITTVVNVRVREAPGTLLGYKISFEDKHKLSETEEKTKEYDEIAFKYLMIVAVPLLLAYAGYSLVYEEHKSWYSFIITTLVGSVYAYGFLMMVPSLYINYRLKSVAHMPRKTMMYKFLNTFVDDLFAFTIKMPTLHRIATLRDDVIFFIYLYQLWSYRVDYSRVNEFGQGGDGEEDEKKETKAIEEKDDSTKTEVEEEKETKAESSKEGVKQRKKKSG